MDLLRYLLYAMVRFSTDIRGTFVPVEDGNRSSRSVYR